MGANSDIGAVLAVMRIRAREMNRTEETTGM